MYSDEQFADEICKIVDPMNVRTGKQIIQLVKEKFSANTNMVPCPHWAIDNWCHANANAMCGDSPCMMPKQRKGTR